MAVRLPRRLTPDGTRELERLMPARLKLDLRLNGVSSAQLTLPPEGGALALGDLVALYDGRGEEAGIFRVRGCQRVEGASSLTRWELEHALATLGDQVIFGPRSTDQLNGLADTYQEPDPEIAVQPAKVGTAIAYLLAHNQMEGIRWRFDTCDFDDAYAFTYRDENLLDAVQRTAAAISGEWAFYYDFSVTPWRLSIRALREDALCRAGQGLVSARLEQDRADFYTRVYPVGKDGLLLDSGGGNIPRHVDAPTMALYGYRCAIQRFPQVTDPRELRAQAAAWLSQRQYLPLSVKLEWQDVWPHTRDPMDKLRLGALCQVPVLGLTQRVTRVVWPDVAATPQRMEVTLAGRGVSAAAALAKLG